MGFCCWFFGQCSVPVSCPLCLLWLSVYEIVWFVVHHHSSGPLRSIMKDLHSDDNEEESDEAEDNDNDSEMERPVNRGGSRSRRWVPWWEHSSLGWNPAFSPDLLVEPWPKYATPETVVGNGHSHLSWVTLACLSPPLQRTVCPFFQKAKGFASKNSIGKTSC